MDVRYEEFCRADRLFYDTPGRVRDRNAAFGECLELPAGWRRVEGEAWTVVAPVLGKLPQQGWKAHVSATLGNCERVLEVVWKYCVARGIAFKHVPSVMRLASRNSKYADRSGSGKFITIYPRDDDELACLLRELGALLDGEEGPYILSDVRWENGPLYVRYGGFARRMVRTAAGESVLAVVDPNGNLVPDERLPVFRVPVWVNVPEFLQPVITARQSEVGAPASFPFRIERALHFSNGGGIYLAQDGRDGRQVVLREARPHAGLDPLGRDAVQRLLRERDVLRLLAGTGVAPEVYEHLTCWEHHFLAQEYIEGTTLGRASATRFPLITPEPSKESVVEYTQWALSILDRVEDALGVLHARGVVFGDLHPHNIIVGPDDSVTLVDFEMARVDGDDLEGGLGAPGYVPPDDRRGAARDLYSLACLRLSMFYPLTTLFPLDPAKAGMIADAVSRRFPVPDGYAERVVAQLALRVPEPSSEVPALASALVTGVAERAAVGRSLAHGILITATPDRDDRLFPGDIEQFTVGGLGLAYGAAGVLHAMHRCGNGRFPSHERWLLDRITATEPKLGFYDGLHGIAWALHELGRTDDAARLLYTLLPPRGEPLSHALGDGVPGIGLNLLHFAEVLSDATLLERAREMAETLLRDRATEPTRPHPPKGRVAAGLLHGGAGRALFLIRLYECTGEERLLDIAERELRADLAQCVVTEHDTLQLDEGWRVLPYVERGSAGIGVVLCEYLALREDPELTLALHRIVRAAEPEFVIGAGLFNGRAGLLAFLAHVREFGMLDGERLATAIERHVCGLGFHVVDHSGHAAVPGDQVLRLSTDLATGAAGVLLALDAADTGRPALPFLSRGVVAPHGSRPATQRR
ncbi:class III lanthionine synthetase LanKC [Streptomyces violaceusniger]|uniref:class III lanthionine synthetase LanKC n=1 Tax=Streptomyces violaceusniger TaxID=68280 RepID=UPI003432C396